jgi:DNA-binding response OmpR family regulator
MYGAQAVAPMRLLLVEDDNEVRETLSEALVADHWQVLAVGSAREALNVPPSSYDAVVTDLHMPGMTGLDLKRELDRRDVVVPFILISSDDWIRDHALRLGCFDYLRKPFSLDQLEAVIRRAFAATSVLCRVTR